MKLALKVDVDTYRGTCEGVPRLVEMLRQHGADATFLFSLGPDHTGRAIRRAFRPGFASKVGRTSVVSHYGVRTLLYGTALPGPDIGRRCASRMREVRDAGFEVGVHAWDHVKWQDGVGRADAEWTQRQMDLATSRFAEVFGAMPTLQGSAGWQMNVHAYRHEQSIGYSLASDTRGTHPFLPVVRAEIMACPQFPTTLPTLDEGIGLDGATAADVAERILGETAQLRGGHVFTLHAELEGLRLAPAFERLIQGWKAQGYELVSLGRLAGDYPRLSLPLHSVLDAPVPGRSGTLATQGQPFLARESAQ